MKNIFSIFTVIIFQYSFGQIQKGTTQFKYYEYCHDHLSIIEAPKAYPNFSPRELCSIKKCFRAISHPEINEIIYNRIEELARSNFKKKIYLFLISGKGSVERAEKENENLRDDNNFIYISVDDFIDAKKITKGVNLYNSETTRLLKIKPNR